MKEVTLKNIKKSIGISFLLLMLAICSIAQEYQYVPFPTSGAVWSERFYPSEDKEYSPSRQIFENFTVTGEDTLINSKSYKKLYVYTDSIFNKSTAKYIGGIREDSLKRILYVGDSIHEMKPNELKGELILYDFSLQVGDTVSEIHRFNAFHQFMVEKIDTIQIGQTLRKRFSFNYSDAVWIEGIGGVNGLLIASFPYLTGDYLPENTLICFIQNDTLLYHNSKFASCFPTKVGVETKITDSRIKVMPNPAKNENIRFEWAENKFFSIDIFANNGLKLVSIHAQDCHLVEYPVRDLTPGVYFYKATSANGITQRGKFVIPIK